MVKLGLVPSPKLTYTLKIGQKDFSSSNHPFSGTMLVLRRVNVGKLVGGFSPTPLKNSQSGFIFPNFRGENQKNI